MDGPPHILSEDDFIIAALNPDDLTADVRQHLAGCSTCNERAVLYQHLAARLTANLYRWDCPGTQEIGLYAAGLFRGKRRRALTLHLQRCPHCAEELQISKQFLASPSNPIARRPRLIARLLPHRMADGVLAGIRGGGSEGTEGWPRQYQVNGISLSLHRAASPAGETGAMLLGLISRMEASPDTFTGVEVRLVASASADQSPLAIEQIDDLGNFILSPIPTGQFDLLIALPEGDLVIEGLELSG
jgi:hypothetical protein